jgi:hypothetical protein
LIQALVERSQEVRKSLARSTVKESDHRHRRLLRAGPERPRRGCRNSLNEIASSHCLPLRLGTNATLQLHQGFAAGGMGFSGQFALHKPTAADVRFGSKADIAASPTNVRFTPNSGHWNSASKCLLCANSGQSALQRKAPLFDYLVGNCQKLRWKR